jgi:putative Ca2+/H+ antiporter (TMEM165/GDT1 family)
MVEYKFFASLLLCSEWGDKSQLAAIALAATYDLWGTALGGILAHILCVTLALALGNILKQFVSER